MHANFISFHDLSPDGRYQYVSPSVTTLLGYTPSEVVGRPAYDFFRDDEIPACRALHVQTIAQEKVAVVVHCHMRHKDGHFIKVSIVSNLTSGGIVASTCRAGEHEILRAREVTGQELHFIESNGVVVSKSWTKSTSSSTPASEADVSAPVPTIAEPSAKPPSPDSWDAAIAAISDTRTCLLIDRFTANLKVVFASPNVSDVFGPSDTTPVPASSSWIVGRSLLDLVDQSARDRVQEEITKAKAMDGICHLRFRTALASADAAPNSHDSFHPRVIDMVLMCTADALIAIARQALALPTTPASAAATAAIPTGAHITDDEGGESVRAWTRRSTVSMSTSQTPTSASPAPHPHPPTHAPAPPVYAPGKGLVILTHNEPKYLDFAPPLALLPVLSDGMDFEDDDEEEDEDDAMDEGDDQDSASCVSYAASGVSDTSSALYAPSSVWAQQSSASTDSDDVDVYARGVNGVIEENFKMAGDAPQVARMGHQLQRPVYRPPPALPPPQNQQQMPAYSQQDRYPHPPTPGFPLVTNYQQQPRQAYANPHPPRVSRPGPYRHHPYAHQSTRYPRASSTFYAYSTAASSLDQCVELNFFHQQQAYPTGPHHTHHQHRTAGGTGGRGHVPTQQPYAHHQPGQEYGWAAGESHPQARVFRYRDASALDAAYGMGKGGGEGEEGGQGDGGSSVDGQVG